MRYLYGHCQVIGLRVTRVQDAGLSGSRLVHGSTGVFG